MEYSFHYLVMAEHAMILKEMLTEAKKYNLTVGQPKILDFLLEHDGIEQKEIAQGCHIEPATLTSLLNRMEKNDLIERRTLNGSRRSFYIFLTENGRKKAYIVKQIFEDIEKKIFHGFSDEERFLLMKLLLKVYENMLV